MSALYTLSSLDVSDTDAVVQVIDAIITKNWHQKVRFYVSDALSKRIFAELTRKSADLSELCEECEAPLYRGCHFADIGPVLVSFEGESHEFGWSIKPRAEKLLTTKAAEA